MERAGTHNGYLFRAGLRLRSGITVCLESVSELTAESGPTRVAADSSRSAWCRGRATRRRRRARVRRPDDPRPQGWELRPMHEDSTALHTAPNHDGGMKSYEAIQLFW